MIPCLWLGFAVQDSQTPFSTFVIISLLCGFGMTKEYGTRSSAPETDGSAVSRNN
jgi:hypothetical protein